jgi:hypothetical protein
MMATPGVTPRPPVPPVGARPEPAGRDRSERRRARDGREGEKADRPPPAAEDEEPPSRSRLDVLA